MKPNTTEPTEQSAIALKSRPLAELHARQVATEKALREARQQKNIIDDALALKLNGPIQAQLNAKGCHTGTVHFVHEGYEVTAEVRKKVIWDEASLVKAADQLPIEVVRDSLRTRFWIPETDYVRWPETLKALVRPARTVKIGRTTFRLARQEAAAKEPTAEKETTEHLSETPNNPIRDN